MIETYIEAHIREQLFEYYSEILHDQILVKFPEATPDYNNKRQNDVITTENLTCHILISDQEKIDRIPIYKAFPKKNIAIETGSVFQTLKKITHTDYLEVYQVKGYFVELNYKHIITEEKK